MNRKSLLLLATATACFLVGCDNAGETVIRIKVYQGLNTRAKPMVIDAPQLGEEHFSHQVRHSSTFFVEQEVRVDTPVKIVLVPIAEGDRRKDP